MALSGFMGVCVVCWPCANEGGVNGAEEAENKKPCLKMGAGEPTDKKSCQNSNFRLTVTLYLLGIGRSIIS